MLVVETKQCSNTSKRRLRREANLTPEISEFSYGFALTNEIVGWSPITAAPIFPSLIEEGKAGGGYDVKLEFPAVALYLQFKRADCMKRRSAREIKKDRLPISIPFFRFKITETGKSDQHELLLALDDGTSPVFYAAPRFHELSEINNAWLNNTVATESIFVAPSEIGTLDAKSHHVAYDDTNAWLCSEPRAIESLNAGQLVKLLSLALEKEKRPLRETIPLLLSNLRTAQQRADETRRKADLRDMELQLGTVFARAVPLRIQPETRQRASTPRIPTKASRALTPIEVQLREASDIAARVFDTQLVLIQKAKN